MFITLRETKIYQGQTRVLVNQIEDPNSPSSSQPPDLSTEQQLVQSPVVAQAVVNSLHLSEPPTTLLGDLNAAPVPNTNVLSIAYNNPSPNFAAKVANGFATAYVRFRSHQAARAYAAAIGPVVGQTRALQQRLGALDAKINGNTDAAARSTLQSQHDSLLAQLGVLQQQLSTLETASATNENDAAQIIERARVPGSPVSPHKVRNAILAVLLGLTLGLFAALFRHRLDIRFNGPSELQKELGAPVLAAVPHVSEWRKAHEPSVVLRSAPRSPIAEVYRTLATNLRYIASEQGIRVVLVTSSVRGEGKTTTAANLAVAIAQSGKRVIAVSADLRRPRLDRFFDIPKQGLFAAPNDGLVDAITGAKSFGQVIHESGIPNLRIIGSGPKPSDPAALLGGDRMVGFFASLRALEDCDFVVVDTPPVLAVADASVMVPHVDSVLLVLDARHTTRTELAQTKAQLDNAGASMVGCVYNNFDVNRTYPGEYYTYGYYERTAAGKGYVDTNGSARHGRLPWTRSRHNGTDAGLEVEDVYDAQPPGSGE